MQRKVTLLSFSQSEMLEEWKMRKGLFSGLRDCTAERDDGVDVDGVLLREDRLFAGGRCGIGMHCGDWRGFEGGCGFAVAMCPTCVDENEKLAGSGFAI